MELIKIILLSPVMLLITTVLTICIVTFKVIDLVTFKRFNVYKYGDMLIEKAESIAERSVYR
jgi:hypothetical protein